MTREDILTSLEKVIDPEIGLNIVDLGLVYDVRIDKEENVSVEYTLTTPGCPLAEVIENDIKEALKKDYEVNNPDLTLVWTPPWTINFMSESARLELGFPI